MKTFSQLTEFTGPAPLCPKEDSKPMTADAFQHLQDSLQKFWNRLGMEVELGSVHSHFFERLNDSRNGKQISFCEVQRLFILEFAKYGKMIAQKKPDFEAVMSDLSSDVNIPFVLKIDPRTHKLDMVAKTIMRKKNFAAGYTNAQGQHVNTQRLTVDNYQPGNQKTMKSRTFQDLREWLGGNINPTNQMLAMPVDDVVDGLHNVEDPKMLAQLNADFFVMNSLQYINPYYALLEIWKKLSIIGLNFDLKSFNFNSMQGVQEAPLTQYGGRYGVLGGPTYISQDDGISNRIPGGLKLVIRFTQYNNIYSLDAKVERGCQDGPFVDPFSEEIDVEDAQTIPEAHGGIPARVNGRTAFDIVFMVGVKKHTWTQYHKTVEDAEKHALTDINREYPQSNAKLVSIKPHSAAPAPAPVHEAETEHKQAFHDWKSGRAYWQQTKGKSGFYKLKPVDSDGHHYSGKGTKAPWSDSVKKKYPGGTSDFHKAATEHAKVNESLKGDLCYCGHIAAHHDGTGCKTCRKEGKRWSNESGSKSVSNMASHKFKLNSTVHESLVEGAGSAEHPFHKSALASGFKHFSSASQHDDFGDVERHEYLHPQKGRLSLLRTTVKAKDGSELAPTKHSWEHRPRVTGKKIQSVQTGKTHSGLTAHLDGLKKK